MKHWVYNYLGKVWTRNYDCFTHFVDVQKNEFGIQDILDMKNLPSVLQYGEALDFAKNNLQVYNMWEKVDELKEGDAVIFGLGVVQFHIGTYVDVDGGGVLHCSFGKGVRFTPMKAFIQHSYPISLQLRYKRG